jgi:hypothetical protein
MLDVQPFQSGILDLWPSTFDLFISVDYPSSCQIVGGQLHQNLIARQDSNEVLAHFARYMCENQMFIFQFNPEHRIRKRFHNRSNNFYCILFGHNHQ